MKSEEFRNILESAVAGEHSPLEQILTLYEPLIRKHSFLNGKYDEDLHQYLLIHIAFTITRFPIND